MLDLAHAERLITNSRRGHVRCNDLCTVHVVWGPQRVREFVYLMLEVQMLLLLGLGPREDVSMVRLNLDTGDWELVVDDALWWELVHPDNIRPYGHDGEYIYRGQYVAELRPDVHLCGTNDSDPDEL